MPDPTGSPAVANTIGITDVACFAARGGGVLWVRMTSTFSRTNSFANPAKRSVCPSAQRYSIVSLWPSSRLSSPLLCKNAAVHVLCAAAVPEPSKPMVASFAPCCARTASGHATPKAAIPSMKARRRIAAPKARCLCGPCYGLTQLQQGFTTSGMGPNVRFGSEADIEMPPADARFTPESGHCGARFAPWRRHNGPLHRHRWHQRGREIMRTQELAKTFTDMGAKGEFDAAGKEFWSDDIVSREPMTGDMAVLKGRKAVEGKGQWWYANHEVHNVEVEGPYVHGDQ